MAVRYVGDGFYAEDGWPESTLADTVARGQRAKEKLLAPWKRNLERSERARKILRLELARERRRTAAMLEAIERTYEEAKRSSWRRWVRWALLAWIRTAHQRAANVDPDC